MQKLQEDKRAHQWGQRKQQHWEQEGKGKGSSSADWGHRQGQGWGKDWPSHSQDKGTEMMKLTMGPTPLETLKDSINKLKYRNESTTHLCSQAVRAFAEERKRVQDGKGILISYANHLTRELVTIQLCMDALLFYE